MTILCISDMHGDAAGLRDMLPILGTVDAVVLPGDITHLGGRAEAEAILSPLVASGVRCIGVAGNMDRDGVRGFLAEKGIDIHCRGLIVDGVGFQGLGGGTPSPFHSPWELGPEEAVRCLAAGREMIKDAPFKVLVSHAPPRNTRIDTTFAHLHVGSDPVREHILSGSVNLCICGHIHEARGEDSLGGVPCVNVGMFKNGHYALVTIEDGGASVTWRTR
jgi:uncharacterized protein